MPKLPPGAVLVEKRRGRLAPTPKSDLATPVVKKRVSGSTKMADYQTVYSRERLRHEYSLLQDIGDIPPCKDPERRESTRLSLKRFGRTYLRKTLYSELADFHETGITKMEACVLEGETFAFAWPRSGGKTSWCEACVYWSLFHGHRHYILFVGANTPLSKKRIISIKVELETNDLFFEDFPEICYPIAMADRSIMRFLTQKSNGVPTRVSWTTDKIVLPTIEGSASSGAIIECVGIGSAIRGVTHKLADGSTIRPDFVLPDDPQTRRSAKSALQTAEREHIITSDLAYLAGPDQHIAMVIPCTKIYEGDLADQLLDRTNNPFLRGEVSPMVAKMPENMEMWQKYREIARASFQNDGNWEPAQEFYRENREAMQRGAEVTWEGFRVDDELDSLEHAMRLWTKDEAAFNAEAQNAPRTDGKVERIQCDAKTISAKLNHLRRLECPIDTTIVSSYIDVQGNCLLYLTTALNSEFTGSVIDYGVWPPQKTRTMSVKNIFPSLEEYYASIKDSGLESAKHQEAFWLAGLKDLYAELKSKSYVLERFGRPVNHDFVMIDAAYGDSTSIVKEFCRAQRSESELLHAFGRYIGATKNSMAQWRKERGETVGPFWRKRRDKETAQRYVIFDSNRWKTFVHSRFKTPAGSPSCWTIYGVSKNGEKLDPHHHLELAFQIGDAEIAKKVTSGNNTVIEWVEIPGRESHGLDMCVGCAIGASHQGASMPGVEARKQAKTRARARMTMQQFFGR